MAGEATGHALALCRPSLVLDDTMTFRTHKACEVLKSFLQGRIRKFIQQAAGIPLLEIYSSDCTPLKVREKHDASWHHLHLARNGRSCREWLVERYFLVDALHRVSSCFDEPRLMSDKTAWSHYSAECDLVDMARESHQGICLSWHVWDRAKRVAKDVAKDGAKDLAKRVAKDVAK